jgi:anti-sigma regulatory factor (Ser/Thr protein kinase)
MPSTLELEPAPRSVREARTWVMDQLTTLGRDDLVDAARLGVSELVTNAILHAAPPIVLRLGGTPVHPRVEVHDSSVEPPALRDMTDDARLLATIGRGLSIVATYSRTWGAEMSPVGKVVWFEPASDEDLSDLGQPATGEITDVAGPLGPAGLGEPAEEARGDAQDTVQVRLLGMPVRVFAHYRLWYDELRRELRLLALSHGTEYPVAQELSALTSTVDAERRRARGVEKLDAAIASGRDSVDLVYDVPATVPATMARLHRVLLDADAFCRENQLLTAAPTRQLLDLRDWYLGEFERQGRGEQPRPWPGGLTVEPPGQ